MNDIFDILEKYLSKIEIRQVRFFSSWSDIPVGTEVGFEDRDGDKDAAYLKWNGKRFVRMKTGVPHLDDPEDDYLRVNRTSSPSYLYDEWVVRKPYE